MRTFYDPFNRSHDHINASIATFHHQTYSKNNAALTAVGGILKQLLAVKKVTTAESLLFLQTHKAVLFGVLISLYLHIVLKRLLARDHTTLRTP